MESLSIGARPACAGWEVCKMFLKGYLTNPLVVASVAPDSRWCVRALLRHARLDCAELILEYGPASGAVTREILRTKNLRARLVCIEKDRTFFDWLLRAIHHDDLHIECQDVFDSDTAIRRKGVNRQNVDSIISTLPCTNLPFESLLDDRVLPYLKKTGVFVQYMHIVSFLRGMFPRRALSLRFHTVRSEIVWLNFPPAIVYTATDPRATQGDE